MGGARRQPGFSLVELMVTVAIAGLLAALALPFGAQWMASDRQLRARGHLVEAVGHARSLALRNPAGLPRGVPAVCVRWAGPRLEVTQLGTGQACPAGGTVVWEAALDPRIRLSEAGTGTPFRCVAFDSRGAPARAALAPECSLAPRVVVEGRTPAEASHVDLL